MEEQAKKVSLYLECSTTALGKKERMCGYVLEYITEKGPAVGVIPTVLAVYQVAGRIMWHLQPEKL